MEKNDLMERRIMNSSSLSSLLHDDLVIEILLRLPVKSLMRFKCVSQCWKALITASPSFITSYNNHNINMKKERAIAFLQEDETRNPPRCIFMRLSDDKSEDLTNPFLQIDPSAEEEESHIRPCGSYKGVFCLYRIYSNYDRCQIILWNPATREVKAIPPPPSLPDYSLLHVHDHCSVTHCSVTLFCGFGGDPNTNDLVIVNLIIDGTRKKMDPFPYVELYNLTTNSWTLISIDNVDDLRTSNGPGSVQAISLAIFAAALSLRASWFFISLLDIGFFMLNLAFPAVLSFLNHASV
ncbi:hypothetical protein RIF29_29034 [Crotalaria pallida]|uniref:F-box domain-containing protein n=1 Tax=Crotalaria pallida TaxID=3830 RepID=A0AAN9EFZ5_CROPI